jgi:hypothetical protein
MSVLPDSDSGEAHSDIPFPEPIKSLQPEPLEPEPAATEAAPDTPSGADVAAEPGGARRRDEVIEWPRTLASADSPYTESPYAEEEATGLDPLAFPNEGRQPSAATLSPYPDEDPGKTDLDFSPHPSEAITPQAQTNAVDEAAPPVPEEPGRDYPGDPDEAPLFAHYEGHVPAPPQRIPNFGHLTVFILLVIGGYLSSGLVVLGALHFHLFGISTLKQATDDIHYTLGSQAAWYLVTFAACTAIFPLLWHRSFLDGLGWRAAAAIRLRWRLVSAAGVCFMLAIVDGVLIPGPPDTPIDQIFRIPGAAWLLFAFGVTLAPFFEEIAYRGFLLPALCTAYAWTTERITGYPAPHLERDGGPHWSMTAMIVASILTSIPFALMHAEQTGYSVGPFLLLMCVSLVLCWVRLATRSLASSVLVHACYNFLLFTLMLAGTGGFRHLDRM